MKTIVILGPTASGKTDMALRLATQHDAAILSLDSLAIYRHIDIASAKPTPEERGEIPHFGIDLITPDQPFNVALYIDLYQEALRFCKRNEKPLIIVGGSSFYLKTLIEGISDLPTPSHHTQERVKKALLDLSTAYEKLTTIDAAYATRITSTDRYRIGKGLEIFYETGIIPTQYFRQHPPRPLLGDVPLFEIDTSRPLLWKRIEKRTETMIENGLVDEVAWLEKRYGRAPHAMKAIGIKEVLDYFDGKLSFIQMQEVISIHTRQLAKRQKTFNKTQLPPHRCAPPTEVEQEISAILET